MKFQDRKDREKSFADTMNAQGAIGAITTKVLVKIQGNQNWFNPKFGISPSLQMKLKKSIILSKILMTKLL